MQQLPPNSGAPVPNSCTLPQCPGLTQDQINEIAERAAEVALEKVYTSIGKSVVRKFLWMLGAAAMAVFAYYKGKGL